MTILNKEDLKKGTSGKGKTKKGQFWKGIEKRTNGEKNMLERKNLKKGSSGK